MSRPDCPDCGSPLPYKADACKACGWSRGPSKPVADSDGMRCTWIADVRCHYVGTLSPNTTGGGPWFCAGHYGCDDGAHGQRIVDESRRNVRGRTWTAEAMKDATKQAYLSRPLPPVPPTPPGVRYPPRAGGSFTSAFAAAKRSSRNEEAIERMAIEEEGQR